MQWFKLSTLLLTIAAPACHDASPRVAIANRASAFAMPAVPIASIPTAPSLSHGATAEFDPTAPSLPRGATVEFDPPPSHAVALATWSTREREHWTGFGKMVAHAPNSGRRLGELPLRAQKVRAVVLGGLSRTEVVAEFQNDNRATIEGQWIFPLPEHAALSRLATWTGNAWIDGEVVDDDQRYHVPQGKLQSAHWLNEPKLLGSHGGEIFRGIVFPIAPGPVRKLLLAYDEVPTQPRGREAYRFPKSMGPGNKGSIDEVPSQPKGREAYRIPISVDPSYRGSIDEVASQPKGREVYRFPMSMDPGNKGSIDDFTIEVTLLGAAVSRPNVTTPGYVAVVRHEADRTIVSFRTQRFRPERDFLVEVEQPDPPLIDLAANVPSWGKAGPQHALFAGPRPEFSAAQDPAKPLGHIAATVRLDSPKDAATTRIVPQDCVVIVDKSHSQSASTLELERRIVKEVLGRAKPNAHIAVLACDSVCERWPGSDHLDVMTWLNRLTPSGASDMEGAIANAALSLTAGRTNQIIWLSDGRATVGELEPRRLIQRIARWIADKSSDLRLIGVGEQVDGNFLTALAKSVGATYDLVTLDRATESQLAEVADTIGEPKLTELKVAFPPGAQDVYPKTWPALRLGQTVTIAGRVTAPLHGALHVTGKLAGRDFVQDVPIALDPGSHVPNPLVGRLYASRFIRDVESNLDNARLEFGMSWFARSTRLASRHTGWILLESMDTMSRDRPAGILPLRPAGISSENAYRAMTPTFSWSRKRTAPGRFSIDGYVRIGPIATSTIRQRSIPEGNLSPISSWLSNCYNDALLVSGDWNQGQQRWFMRIAPSGKPEAIAVEGLHTAVGAELAECVGQQASYFPLHPLADESIELRFTADARIDWSRGTAIWPLDMGAPQPADWGPAVARDALSIETAIRAGNEGWRTTNSVAPSVVDADSRSARQTRLRSLLKGGKFAQATAESERAVAADPDDRNALELLAMAAGATQDKSRSVAALEALLELRPDDDNIRLIAAQVALAAGDERRACAHLRGIRVKSDEVFANALRCRFRWFREGHTAIAESERLEMEALGQTQPRFWQVVKDIALGVDIAPPSWQVSECHDFRVFVHCEPTTSRCPEAVVVTPSGDVVSALAPMPGKGLASPLAFWMKTAGTYQILLVGGDKSAKGTVEVRIADASAREFRFARGAILHTIATVIVRSNEHSPSGFGGHFCIGG